MCCYRSRQFIIIFNPRQICFRGFKNWDIQNWVGLQFISPCSQTPARCHVRRQHCSTKTRWNREAPSLWWDISLLLLLLNIVRSWFSWFFVWLLFLLLLFFVVLCIFCPISNRGNNFVRHQTRSSFHQLVSAPSASEPFRLQLFVSGTDCRHTSHRRRRYTYSNAIWRRSFSCEVFPPPLRNRQNYHHCTGVHVEHLLLILCVPWHCIANLKPYAKLIIFVY